MCGGRGDLMSFRHCGRHRHCCHRCGKRQKGTALQRFQRERMTVHVSPVVMSVMETKSSLKWPIRRKRDRFEKTCAKIPPKLVSGVTLDAFWRNEEPRNRC